MKNACIAILLCVALATPAYAEKCYGLALSSGDESVAYQVGVLKGLIESLPSDQVGYDVISGVQGGALNAAIFARHDIGKEQDTIQDLENFWYAAANSTLYKNWFGGIADGLMFQGGLYDSTPLKTFLEGQFEAFTSNRETVIGLVDYMTGDYRDFDETIFQEKENLVNLLYTSFSIPGYFAPVEAFGSTYFDGSAIWDIDVTSVINKCLLKTGGNQEDVIVDVIMVNNDTMPFQNTSDYNAFEMFFRYLAISRYYGIFDGLLRA